MKRTLLFSLLLVSSLLIFGQSDSTKVRFYVKGSSDFYIQLDGELLPLSNRQMIIPGEHSIQIWSPMHEIYKGKITVPAKDSISYYRALDRDPAYVSYLFEHDAYERKIFLGRTMPLMLAGVGAIAAPILFFTRKNTHESLVIQEFKSEYYTDGTNIESVRQRYNMANAFFFTSAGLAVGGLITHLVLKKTIKELKKPVYKQVNPFTLETFILSYNPLITGPQAGLTLNF